MPARAASTQRVGARCASSLLELVVVIVVIGILAAIAVPRLSQAATQSGLNAMQQDLAVLQKQIDLYAVEHSRVYPGSSGMPAFKCGPKAGSDGVLVVTGVASLMYQVSQEVGWIFNDTTGEIIANAPGEFRAGVLHAIDSAVIERGR